MLGSGDAWRTRWEGLRLFTPGASTASRACRSPAIRTVPDEGRGRRLPRGLCERHGAARSGRASASLTSGRQMMAAASGSLTDDGDYAAEPGRDRHRAYDRPRIPDFAAELDPTHHAAALEPVPEPSQLREGAVLVVGASNSGAEIALMAARDHRTVLVWPQRRQDAVPAGGSAGAHLRHILLVLRQPHRDLGQSDRPQGGS